MPWLKISRHSDAAQLVFIADGLTWVFAPLVLQIDTSTSSDVLKVTKVWRASIQPCSQAQYDRLTPCSSLSLVPGASAEELWRMRLSPATAATASALLLTAVLGDPTWPAETDELEEIMYQIKEFKMRNFADTITPCSNEASGPGRQNAAEWLRTGFHDMSTANVQTGEGGLDGSLQYQLDDGESLGPGFNTTLHFLSNYVSKRSSLADLIALGVYASVRSCGGPVIPVRGGRIDASGPGNTGVPQPEHSIEQYYEQFGRMGFSPEEMIQLTACGHTLGGVHDTEFPELVVAGEAPSDSTVDVFDEKIITEYLDNNTTNPLVVGPAIAEGKDSDTRIFNSDGNATIMAMSEPEDFQNVCQNVLQKMIEVVPQGVILSEPIQPYTIKPVGLQLTLERGGSIIRFTGNIRVRTTDLPPEQIASMQIRYKDRNGREDCGPSMCMIYSSVLGAGYGLDDSFAVGTSAVARCDPGLTMLSALVLPHRC